ncbi:hypothetical protein BY458DRAFT_495834 [Sporodiniella umbellata]|nr:hypothetical protein BY458DRAFT_495834 [Sporodiniella umbellata]
MEGLHSRKKKKTNPEDQVEYLDEVEQEALIKDLNQQNDKANSDIIKGLLVVNCLSSLLFLGLLAQASKKPVIPIAHVIVTTFESLALFRMAVISSVMAINLSFIALVVKSRTSLFSIYRICSPYTQQIAVSSLLFALAGPLLGWAYGTSQSEIIFWCLPFFISVLYGVAYSVMKQVGKDLEQLEKLKYNYAGA